MPAASGASNSGNAADRGRRDSTGRAPLGSRSDSGGLELGDGDAVARARDGDHAAFRVLVERYQGRVFRLCARVLKNEEQARDACQDAFLKAYRALDRFEGRSSFYTWMYRLALNVCLDMRRKDKSARHDEWDDTRGVGEETVEPSALGQLGGSDPFRELERGELREFMARAIAALPEDARRTLILREVDGLSYAEIAKALEIPKGTVMSRLYYARRKVKELLLEAGVQPPGGGGEGGYE